MNRTLPVPEAVSLGAAHVHQQRAVLLQLGGLGVGEQLSLIHISMCIRDSFIPTLIEETDKIMSAQKARGADMESGGLMQRIKALIPILIPLFVSSFRRAYELAMACLLYTSRCV